MYLFDTEYTDVLYAWYVVMCYTIYVIFFWHFTAWSVYIRIATTNWILKISASLTFLYHFSRIFLLSSHYKIKTQETRCLILDLLVDVWVVESFSKSCPIHGVYTEGILSDGFNPTMAEDEDSDSMYISVPHSVVYIYTGGLLNTNHLRDYFHFRLIPSRFTTEFQYSAPNRQE